MSLIAVVWKGDNWSFSTVASQAWRDCYFYLCSFNRTQNICHKIIVWCGSKGFSQSESSGCYRKTDQTALQPIICQYLYQTAMIKLFNNCKNTALGIIMAVFYISCIYIYIHLYVYVVYIIYMYMFVFSLTFDLKYLFLK